MIKVFTIFRFHHAEFGSLTPGGLTLAVIFALASGQLGLAFLGVISNIIF